jgi:hypothetical protein
MYFILAQASSVPRREGDVRPEAGRLLKFMLTRRERSSTARSNGRIRLQFTLKQQRHGRTSAGPPTKSTDAETFARAQRTGRRSVSLLCA